MKKLFILLIVTLFPITMVEAQSPLSEEQFVFQGKVVGQPDGYVFLSYLPEDGKYMKDSCKLKEGKFEFKGFIAEPTEAYFTGRTASSGTSDPNFVSLFLEPGKMHAVFKVNHFKAGKISGSKTQKEHELLEKKQREIEENWEKAREEYKRAKDMQDSVLIKKTGEKLSRYRAAYYKVYYDFINGHRDSYVSATILDMLSGGHISLDSVKLFFNRLTARIQQSKEGKRIADFIERSDAVALGQTAPDFTLNNMQDIPISLKDFKGKYVLIDFWASWCVPCREENPFLMEAYKRYKKEGFTIIGISTDRDLQKWKKAVKEDRLPWTQLIDSKIWKGSVRKRYSVVPIPDNFLIDPDGKILARDLRGKGLLNKLERVFNTQ